MTSFHSANISAPSASLLRFLKFQTESVCFFTSNTAPFRNPCSRSQRRCQRQLPSQTASSRFLSTTPRRQAVVESSLLNLDFLQTGVGKNPFHSLSLGLTRRPSAAAAYIFQNGLNSSRKASKDARPLLERLGLSKRRSEPAPNPSILNPLPSFLDDAGGTTLGRSAGKASNELKLRCTEFDENGNVTLVNGEFKKSELIAKVRLRRATSRL